MKVSVGKGTALLQILPFAIAAIRSGKSIRRAHREQHQTANQKEPAACRLAYRNKRLYGRCIARKRTVQGSIGDAGAGANL
jgi:hypothetical protein